MSSVNKVILVGHTGAEPEMRYMPNGEAVTNLSLATSEKWKDKNTGDVKESTEWHRVVLYRRLAEIAGEYVRKGAQIYIEGRLQTRKWADKDGVERYTTEVIADELKMLGAKQADEGEKRNPPGGSRPRNQVPMSKNPRGASIPDDDVPF